MHECADGERGLNYSGIKRYKNRGVPVLPHGARLSLIRRIASHAYVVLAACSRHEHALRRPSPHSHMVLVSGLLLLLDRV